MAGIKDCLQDILTQLTTLQVVNQSGQTVPLYARIFNNQVEYEAQGKGVAFPKPAAFVEIVTPATYQVIGQGYRDSDLSIRIHLVHEFMDAADGTFDQDLAIFDLRDQILVLLTKFTPAGCGPMNCMVESQSYTHTQIYEYILDFVCNFTDSKGSPLDPARTVYTPSIPPLDVDIEVTTGQGGGQMTQQPFLINK